LGWQGCGDRIAEVIEADVMARWSGVEDRMGGGGRTDVFVVCTGWMVQTISYSAERVVGTGSFGIVFQVIVGAGMCCGMFGAVGGEGSWGGECGGGFEEGCGGCGVCVGGGGMK
jgi:hypothetical protein